MRTLVSSDSVPRHALIWNGSDSSLKQLLSYAVGFYQGLFVGLPVQYPGSKEQFFYRVLRDGYQLPEVVEVPDKDHVNLDEHLMPCEDVQALHGTCHDVNAWRFMVNNFAKAI